MFRYAIVLVGILAACSSDSGLTDPISFAGSAAITVTTTGDRPTRMATVSALARRHRSRSVSTRRWSSTAAKASIVWRLATSLATVAWMMVVDPSVCNNNRRYDERSHSCRLPDACADSHDPLASATSSAPNEVVTYWLNVGSGIPDVMPTGQVAMTVPAAARPVRRR